MKEREREVVVEKKPRRYLERYSRKQGNKRSVREREREKE